MDNTGELKKITTNLDEINGSLQKHVRNTNIHVPKQELVPLILFDERTLTIQRDISAIFQKLDK